MLNKCVGSKQQGNTDRYFYVCVVGGIAKSNYSGDAVANRMEFTLQDGVYPFTHVVPEPQLRATTAAVRLARVHPFEQYEYWGVRT